MRSRGYVTQSSSQIIVLKRALLQQAGTHERNRYMTRMAPIRLVGFGSRVETPQASTKTRTGPRASGCRTEREVEHSRPPRVP